MAKTLLGRKLRMTHMFDDNGVVIPLTAIEVGPCPVVQVKRPETDGYCAYQIGFGEARERSVTKALLGHFNKAGVSATRYLREVRCANEAELPEVGATLSVEAFEEGEFVDVTGTSKGKGFQGVVRRHHFGGQRATHGQMESRVPGSIGASSYPSRVFKGTRMNGRMGGARVTVLGLKIAKIDPENRLIYVRGCVPGPDGRVVEIRTSNRGKARKAK
ncbi:MAG: 50S ribosomal protein L3 [Candidatus Omnitrophica bacterium]|nr:50S ribosomal protein L3 [Candidatus Omnitrophota bacterium]